ncbi:MAG TPA: hypothetical protein VGJ45_40485 [Pseudonocardiaceae bacterium]|jgi:hypothetical protein
MISIRLRKTITAVAAGGLAVAGMLVAVPSASAAPADDSLLASYPINGSTTIKATSSSMNLGPGTLDATLDVDNNTFSADLNLPPATGSFTELGFLPVTATTEFVQDGATTGAVDGDTGGIASTSTITIRLTDVKIAGIDVPVGNSCQTSPATVQLTSEDGFNVLTGGNISGTYTIPKFSNCGLLNTPIINAIIPGSGNTITLTLGEPTVTVPSS